MILTPKKTILLPAHRWAPRYYQIPLWRYLDGGGKRAAAVWHRRSGKDELALQWTAVASQKRVGTYWHMLPSAAQARKAIWSQVNPKTGRRRIDDAFPTGMRAVTRDNEMFMQFRNGSTWNVVGSDNYDSLVGTSPIGVVFSEWSLADPAAWAYIRPILAENDGWALFIYTPRGSNHGRKMYDMANSSEEWFASLLEADKTGVFTPEQLDRERSELVGLYGEDIGDAFFNQEYFCSFSAAMIGSVYGALLTKARQENRIGRVPHDPSLKVDTFWDIGVNDATAIWFTQNNPAGVRLIDYYEARGHGVDHYADLLKTKPYSYGHHIGPHDIGNKDWGITKGRSRADIAAELGINFDFAPKLSLEDGINAVRLFLPRCFIDAEKCERGLTALEHYHYNYDDRISDFKREPVHDWSSHAADSLRYGALMSHFLSVEEVVPDRYAQKQYKMTRGGSKRSWMRA